MARRLRILRTGLLTRPVKILKELSTGPRKASHLAKLFGITSAQLGGTLASLESRGLIERVRRGLYKITEDGSEEVISLPYMGISTEVKGQTVPMGDAPEPVADIPSVKREKKPLHWAVKALFDLATERGVRNDQELEELIIKKTGKRIPKNTLRYWKNGWSEPKISEVELIAKALDQELELMDNPINPPAL
jgi:DNA-binding PadR family transcriptional regulator